MVDPVRGEPRSSSRTSYQRPSPNRSRDAIDDGSSRASSVEPRPVREYPEGSIAPQILGFIGKDRDGLAGLEYCYDSEPGRRAPA